MVGITAYGGYLPRLRLNRMSIYQGMGWYIPALVMVAQGERSFCNWDEDSLTMAVAAAQDCLQTSDPSEIDALYLASTTLPYADRSAASLALHALNFRETIAAADFTTSQKAGTAALLAALDAVKAGSKRNVLVAASDKRETRSASFYEMWYGDGAASLLIGSEDVIASFQGSFSIAHDFVDHYRTEDRHFSYTWEERWIRDEGYSKVIPEAIQGLLKKTGLSIKDVHHLVFPCFFKAEHAAIAKKLGASKDQVQDNLHEVCGEVGSAHPLLMLAGVLERAKPGEKIIVASFGQGCDALLFEVTDAITKLSPRKGLRGSLEAKEATDNYFKFLSFRKLIQTEKGIRAEAPMQTAMTTLWRKRKMVLGFVGSRCKKCQTPQYPPAEICVRPDCRHIGEQEDYPFAGRSGQIKSFTGDMLAVSEDPPAIYGMIDFEGGGRIIADFTDCRIDDVRVGQTVKMSFRKKYTDDARGFHGYFWKALPQASSAKASEDAQTDENKSEPIRFDGQVAVITGAGGGLGRVYALDLARRGAKVVVNDLGGKRDGTGGASLGPAEKVVEEIRALGGEAIADGSSVATPEGGEALIAAAVQAFGRVDILINNAGILRDKSFLKTEPSDWQSVLAVHLDGAYHASKPAFRQMKEQGYGRIVMTTSAAGLYGNFGQANYSAAKLGLVGLMLALKEEGAKYKIFVNTVAPLAASRMTEDIFPPEVIAQIKPEAVSPLVIYLASSACTDTGQIYNAGMGYFNRSAVLTGPTTLLTTDGQPPSAEDILDNFASIDDLSDPLPYANALAFLGDLTSSHPRK